MEYKETVRGVEVTGLGDFHLAETLECGQCFRWDALPDGSYRGIAHRCEIRICLEDGTFVLYGVELREFEAYWVSYFDLALDYGEVKRALCRLEPRLIPAAQYAPGIRVLRQDPWEALATFILSQNNNIPRIRGIVERMCRCFGVLLPGGGYAFPTAERLALLEEADLAPLRCGFRARYLLDAARKVAGGGLALDEVAEMPLSEARDALMKIRGVGPKVADCALLYGMHRLDAFPMDVWIKRAMAVLLPDRKPQDLGEYAGIAQQYLFHYSRMHPELFEEERAV
jgi:N-glycosylase/DNA lyase